jgi:hypothetical protein
MLGMLGAGEAAAHEELMVDGLVALIVGFIQDSF